MGRLANYRVFLRQFFQRYYTTGAILPSGAALSRALCRQVRAGDDRPRKILEVGPGTGPVTETLLGCLRPQDQLTLVELNDDFVEHLRGRFDREPLFKNAAPQCGLVHGRLEELPGEGTFDLIISGLPLNNFKVAEVEAILDSYRRLLKPDGVLSYFEYIAIRRAKSVVGSRADRQRLTALGELLGQMLAGREILCEAVWRNVPPAWVHHVRLHHQPQGASSTSVAVPV